MSELIPRAIRFHAASGPLLMEPVATLEPGPGEVQLRMHAIGLNRVEELFWAGAYFVKPVFPSRLGVEGAGVVERVGSGVDPAWLGARVALIPSIDMTAYGVAGEVAVVPSRCLVRMPDDLSFNAASATWMAYLTAYGALLPGRKINAGDTVLINAASSSVGLAMIDMVRAAGGSSIAMTRSGAKRARLLEHGASAVVAGDEDLVEAVHAVTGGRGVRLAFDPVAGAGVARLAEAVADEGELMIGGFLGTDMLGYSDGQPTPFPFFQAVARNLNVRGYNLQGLMAKPRELEEAKVYISQQLAGGLFTPRIDTVFPLAQIEEAYAYMRTGRQVGKIVLRV